MYLKPPTFKETTEANHIILNYKEEEEEEKYPKENRASEWPEKTEKEET